MEPKEPTTTDIAALDYSDFVQRLEAGVVKEPSPEAVEAAEKDYKEFINNLPPVVS